MKAKMNSEELIHHLAASIGGFFGAYAILNRHENFGSSATSNLIIIISDLLGHSLREAFIRIIALLIYISAIVITVILSKKTSLNVKKTSLFLSLCASLILFFLPEKMNYIVSLYPIFFITAFQWSAFIGAGNYASSTIFSTNNIRVTITGYTNYLISKDAEQLEKARFYGKTLIFFHIGVIYEYFFFRLFGVKSSLTVILPVLICYAAIKLSESKEKNTALSASFSPLKIK